MDGGLDERESARSGSWRQVFSALRNPNYRYFYFGQALSLIGTWTRTAALGWITYQFTHSAFYLGIVFMLNALPLLVFSTYAGALADRVPKIRIFTVTSWFSLASSALIGIMLFLGPVHIVYLMIFALLWGLSSAFEMPARQTLMVELVGKSDLVNAIALNSAMVNSTRVIGPAVGAMLIHAVGAPWCFLLDAFSYLAVLYGLSKIQLPASHYTPQRITASWDHTMEGFRFLRTNTKVATAIAMMAVMSLGGWAYQSQLSAFVVSQLHQDVKVYGWLYALNGLGACTAAFFVAVQGARIVNSTALFVGAGLYSIFIILFGFMIHPLAAALLLFFAGFGIILFFSVGNSIVQTQSPDHLRGRLMGIWALVFGGGMPLGSFWMGLIAQHTTSGFALQAGGAFCAVGAIVVYSAFRP